MCMASILDRKRRVILPKEVVDELGLTEGSKVAFERQNGKVTLRKAAKKEDTLLAALSWNPKRTRGKLLPMAESEIKKIWGDS